MDLKIRDMNVDDIPRVFAIGNRVFTNRENIFLYRTWEAYEITGPYTTDPDLCIVAELDNNVVGFSIGNIITKPKSPWTYGYLVWIGVDKEYQKYDVGRKIYLEMEKRAKKMGARMMMIDTEGSNQAAIRFFIKMGFRKGSEHVWMSKNLTSSRSGNRIRPKQRFKKIL